MTTSPGRQADPAFRGRVPTPLAFGTSGLRGLVDDITDLEVTINTQGFLAYLAADGQLHPGDRIALGGDLRPSTGRILQAVARSVSDAGYDVDFQGLLPTPALAHYGVTQGIASIMVTGSHIPFDRNGIKFNRPDGEVLKSDEAPILREVQRLRAQYYVQDRDDSAFDDRGGLREPGAGLAPAADAAWQGYRERYLRAFPGDALDGLRIGYFAHSAVGRDCIPDLLRTFGAEVHVFGRADAFVAIDTEALSAATLADLQREADALAERVGPLHAVLSTDGDSDRPMLLGCREDGRLLFFSGDLLGLVVAEYLQADSICVPISATDAIDRHFAARGLPVQHTRIGSPWVIDAMNRSAGERRVGWEANGGFLTASPIATTQGELDALPTRDAVLPMLAALYAARSAGRSLVAHFADLPRRTSRAGLLDQVAPADSRSLLDVFGPGDELRRIRFTDGQIRAEGRDGNPQELSPAQNAALQGTAERLSGLFAEAAGCTGGLREMDALDGLRLYFGDGDIAHIRPSGNAPQLRIYAVADTAERAEAIVAAGLREPDGLLRTLLAEARGAG